ncbi:CoA ester lyase [Nostocoides sp. HKS02]|uniref:HpcH/HpaI aldolase/citrate lyase family protein n=1 Tax=Nostocoides sp. HKS02 TaxID=1813880 RepID=UPI0012B4EF05|nr:CoA ester lyase [Tetrasphaera sp. HKS02]QGN58880.1 CoA ester lyase [Tetrasphaera sp. HKS02]
MSAADSTRTAPSSWLYVPATAAHMLASAPTRGSHAVIVDLEDAVPSSAKSSARTAASDWLAKIHPDRSPHSQPEIWVRVNAGDEGIDDLVALGCPDSLTGVVLPKAERAGDVHRLAGRLEIIERSAGRGEPVAIAALIETVAGAERVREIANVPRVRFLHLGEADLAADLRVQATDEEAFAGYRQLLVHASRLSGLSGPVGPVSTVIDDASTLRTSSELLARIGYSGRACIHPNQVSIANLAFGPQPEDASWARDVLSRLEQAAQTGSGVARDEQGRMIDEALARRARQILSSAAGTA